MWSTKMDKHALFFVWEHACGVFLLLVNILDIFLLLEVVWNSCLFLCPCYLIPAVRSALFPYFCMYIITSIHTFRAFKPDLRIAFEKGLYKFHCFASTYRSKCYIVVLCIFVLPCLHTYCFPTFTCV